MIAAIATRAGSGSFFTFHSNPMVTSAISPVSMSTIDRFRVGNGPSGSIGRTSRFGGAVGSAFAYHPSLDSRSNP